MASWISLWNLGDFQGDYPWSTSLYGVVESCAGSPSSMKLATKPPALFIMIAFFLRPLKIDPAFFCDVVASLENRKADCQPASKVSE